MIKHLSLILAGGLALAMAAHAQDVPVPPTPPEPPPAGAHVWGGVVKAGSYLGVMLEEVDDDNRERLAVDGSGAVITSVTPGSPAATAGLLENDVVVGFNGEKIESARELSRNVRRTSPGTTVKLDIVRSGRPMQIDATIGERTIELPKSLGVDLDSLKDRFVILRGRLDSLGTVFADSAMHMRERFSFEHPDGDRHVRIFIGGRPRLGAELQPMTPQLAKYFGVESRKGALVGSVLDSGAGRAAGLQAGDVIVAIDGKEVASPADVTRIVGSKESGPVELTVVRDRSERTLRVDLPEPAQGGSSNGAFHFNDGRGMRFFGDGRELHFFNDGTGDSLSFNSEMFRELEKLRDLPELRELEKLRDLPELRELERLPDMIREQIERERALEEAGNVSVEADVSVETNRGADEASADEFGNLPDASEESAK